MGNPRDTALRALVDAEKHDRFIDASLAHALATSGLDSRDTALATELTYGVVRHRGTLDHALNRLASRPLERQPAILRNILRLGAYQLMFLTSVPPHAAVNESVKLARRYGHRGQVGFANGVLRALSRSEDPLQLDQVQDIVRRLAIEYSYPQWLVRRWFERWGERRTRDLLKAGNERPTVSLRTNTLQADRETLIERLKSEGARALPGPMHPWAVDYVSGPAIDSLASFHDGWFIAQNEASMLAAQALGVRPGETVLDACAAPGGKTTQLAQQMRDQGTIHALDVSAARLSQLRENARRLRIRCIQIVEGDARDAANHLPGPVDRALVDAPCSNLGVLARRPDARWNRSEDDLGRLAGLQLELLRAASGLVRPGGILVYSTCTIEPEENAGVIRRFLKDNADWQTDSLSGMLPDEVLRKQESNKEGFLQLYPDLHGTDGMFIARLRRHETEEVAYGG